MDEDMKIFEVDPWERITADTDRQARTEMDPFRQADLEAEQEKYVHRFHEKRSSDRKARTIGTALRFLAVSAAMTVCGYLFLSGGDNPAAGICTFIGVGAFGMSVYGFGRAKEM